MKYKENFEKILERYAAFWKRENENNHIVSIKGENKNFLAKNNLQHSSLKERWCDVDYIIRRTNLKMENTYFGCDSFPLEWADLGPDQFASFYGTELEFGEDTSWAKHNILDIDEFKGFHLDKSNFYYKKLNEITEALVEDGKNKYFVGIPDLHPGLDGLVSMRGPQELCIDTFENPNFMKQGAMELLEGFKEVLDEMYSITTKYQNGSSNWMGIWHPQKWYVTCCDFCCMISKEMFEEFVVDELEEELKFLDASIFHLDGPGALQHLDRLLEFKKLKGIQWVYGAGSPPAPEWLHIIKKIQDAGKILQIEVAPKDLTFMLENTDPLGIMFTTYADSIEEAKELEEMVMKFRR